MTTPAPTAVVTGASRGLGHALVHSLHADGWGVVLDARHAVDLAATVDGLGGPAPVVPVVGDVTDPAHREDLATAAASLGGIDLVVLNAGTLGPSPLPPVSRLDLGDLRATLETNLVAQVGMVQALLPHLRPGAAVVVVTSDAAVEPYQGWGAYAASKAGLEQLAAVLAVERPDLRVLRVDPGDMRTQMHQDAFPGEDISDRPPPEASVPGLRRLVDDGFPSRRYRVADLHSSLEVA
jgi:NAD(P)-dependent dehydrogenase (short-subunit alcohol dehydrogenase family)